MSNGQRKSVPVAQCPRCFKLFKPKIAICDRCSDNPVESEKDLQFTDLVLK